MKHHTLSIVFVIFTLIIFLSPNFVNGYTTELGVQIGDEVDIGFEGTKQSDGSTFQTIARADFVISSNGGLIEGFWKGVLGMKVGEDKQITVEEDEGYTEPTHDLYNEVLIFNVHVYRIVNNINENNDPSGNLSGTIGTVLTVIGVIVVSAFVIIGIYGLRSKAISADCIHCESMGRKNISAEGKCSKCGESYCRASFSRGCPNCKGNSFIPN